MRDDQLGATLRAVRLRRGWRQSDVAARAGLARSRLSQIERGGVDRVSVGLLRRYCSPLDVSVEIHARWRGGELGRLLDADHAALQESCARQLTGLGWLVQAEVSFSRYGERGRFDLLARHVATDVVAVIEIKTVIADVQDLLGTLDAKVRLAPRVALDLGWPGPRAVVPMLVVSASRTNRRRLADHRSLFGRFSLRGRSAASWLRRPAAAGGVLVIGRRPNVTSGDRRHAGTQRVRHHTGDASVKSAEA